MGELRADWYRQRREEYLSVTLRYVSHVSSEEIAPASLYRVALLETCLLEE